MLKPYKMKELQLLDQKQIRVNEIITLFILSQDVCISNKKSPDYGA